MLLWGKICCLLPRIVMVLSVRLACSFHTLLIHFRATTCRLVFCIVRRVRNSVRQLPGVGDGR